MKNFAVMTLVFFLLATIFLCSASAQGIKIPTPTPAPSPTPTATPTPDPLASLKNGIFINQSAGWSVRWNNNLWNADVLNDGNSLRLSTWGTEFTVEVSCADLAERTTEACIRSKQSEWTSIAILDDGSGKPLESMADDYSWSVYRAVYMAPGNDRLIYSGARFLQSGDILVITATIDLTITNESRFNALVSPTIDQLWDSLVDNS